MRRGCTSLSVPELRVYCFETLITLYSSGHLNPRDEYISALYLAERSVSFIHELREHPRRLLSV